MDTFQAGWPGLGLQMRALHDFRLDFHLIAERTTYAIWKNTGNHGSK